MSPAIHGVLLRLTADDPLLMAIRIEYTIFGTGILICLLTQGCVSRAIREGVGAVRGASGKAIVSEENTDFSRYRGITIETITINDGLRAPSNLTALVRKAYRDAGDELDLGDGTRPAIAIKGEVIHYESDRVIDKAIGPLQEIIVRTDLYDADTGQLLGRANLVGRSKATTSSGEENLCEGVGKALKKWLEPDED